MSKLSVEWVSDSVYCGGGAKLEKPVEHGSLTVEDDGSVSVSPDDDYYGGTIGRDDALKLARAIVEAHGLYVNAPRGDASGRW